MKPNQTKRTSCEGWFSHYFPASFMKGVRERKNQQVAMRGDNACVIVT